MLYANALTKIVRHELKEVAFCSSNIIVLLLITTINLLNSNLGRIKGVSHHGITNQHQIVYNLLLKNMSSYQITGPIRF